VVGGAGNWTDNNWSISGQSAQDFPESADTVIVGGTGAYVLTTSGIIGSEAHDVTLDNASAVLKLAKSLIIQNSFTIQAGAVSVAGGDLIDASAINDGTIESNGLGAFLNQISGNLTNNGVISVDGDHLRISGTTTLTNNGTVFVTDSGSLELTGDGVSFTNTGLITISNGGTLNLSILETAGSSAGDVKFLDGSASTLEINSVSIGEPPTVEGFQGENAIDLFDVLPFDPGESAEVQNGTIVVSNEGTTAVTIPISGVESGTQFNVVNDGTGDAR
jgi:hypothetical protein